MRPHLATPIGAAGMQVVLNPGSDPLSRKADSREGNAMTESQEAWTLAISAPTERDTEAEAENADGWQCHKDSGLRHIDAKLTDPAGVTFHLSIRAHVSEWQEGPHPAGPRDKLVFVMTDRYAQALAGRGVDPEAVEVHCPGCGPLVTEESYVPRPRRASR